MGRMRAKRAALIAANESRNTKEFYQAVIDDLVDNLGKLEGREYIQALMMIHRYQESLYKISGNESTSALSAQEQVRADMEEMLREMRKGDHELEDLLDEDSYLEDDLEDDFG